ncbi:MAG: hypothetical protein B7733_09710 [Myxococcales bacterium FL481]|nr:MAG: hypothetical protein B7733_09710 [Myxococcales bacterium FL481]
MPFTELLVTAAREGFVRVRLASDRPILLLGAGDAQTRGEALPTDRILDAITPSLPTSQQAELALGEPARWVIDVPSGRWQLEARASVDSVTVTASLATAQVEAAAAACGGEMMSAATAVEPPSEPVAEAAPSRSSAPSGAGGFGVAGDDEVPPTAASPVDLAPSVAEDTGPGGHDDEGWLELAPAPSPPAAPTGSGESLSSPLIHVLARPPVADRGLQDSTVPPATDTFGVRDALDEDTPGDATRGSEGAPQPRDFDDTPPLGAARYPSRREGDGSGAALDLPAGSLCFVADRHVSELVRRVRVISVSIGDGARLDRAEAEAGDAKPPALPEDPAESCVVVRDEDPSRWLGFCLRRLEEGFRVLVTTRARTSAGAVRVLLGLDATARAEAWLAEHPVYRLHVDRDEWRLLGVATTRRDPQVVASSNDDDVRHTGSARVRGRVGGR